jgi:hypothetical protein
MTTIPSRRLIEALKTMQISKSGYGGVLPNGNIVDRREHPEAIPIQANKMLGVPKPKKINKTEVRP